MKFITLSEVPKLNETSHKTMAYLHKLPFLNESMLLSEI